MTIDEKRTWLQNYLANCLGEELPNIQEQYTFGHHTLPDDQVLSEMPTIIVQGRIIKTISLDNILQKCENIDVLTKQSFGVMCTNDPILQPWYLWNIERGMFEL
jgi:hypothetical protein